MHKKENWFFPIESGQYKVEPGLSTIDHTKDLIFDFDRNYSKYISVKNLQRGKYKKENFTRQKEVCEILCKFLDYSYPDLFYFNTKNCHRKYLDCFLMKERLVFDKSMTLLDVHDSNNIYTDSFDAIVSQLQEDVCVIQKHPSIKCVEDKNKKFSKIENDKKGNWISAIHLNFENGWTAQEKIGKSFNEIHKPVAMFDKISKNEEKIVTAMIEKGPFERFAWGLQKDNLLNKSEGIRYWSWSPYYISLRVERQIILGLNNSLINGENDTAIFLIRTYIKKLYDLLSYNEEQFKKLNSAIMNMPEAVQKYKGYYNNMKAIEDCFNRISNGL